ncbi:ATPase [Desulfuromonas versatilis]|uniref:ATPase n=1 Tax=Desulfuromonas versatilis TaxID=2802975 RepID=A0ABM8HVZ5_9BACT|nr:XrtA/PEP-CTERM system-associated ATPase [Desulfuromonas versatilis]BCR05285.1 ATPase [Desulfuromonas versatilis]
MYESFFGLKSKPFELVPNPAFLFPSASHKKALNYLQYGIRERAGFILFTGEVGAGKTTIIRDIVNNLEDDVALSLVFNTSVNGEQLIAMINEDFGLEATGKGKVELLRELNDFLVERAAERVRPILIIDEAQNLSAEALEEIRLLSNLEADSFKLIQIILVGQPELKKVLSRNELRQLRQRISINCHLDSLSRQETEDYVYHRLETAGNRAALDWQKGTFDALFNYSGGIPRLINVFCDFVLLAAFVEETRQLTLAMVEEVIGDVAWVPPNVPAVENSSLIAHHSSLNFEEIIERIDRLEERFSQLDAVQLGKEHFAERLAAQEVILKKLVDRQEKDFRRLEDGLAKIAEVLVEMRKEGKAEKAAAAKPKPIDILEPRVQVQKRGVWARIFG